MGTHRNEVKIESADFADRWNVRKLKSAEDPKSRRGLHERAAAAGAGAGGATKAMAAGEDFAILHHRGIDVPEMKHAVSIVPVHVQHLIEIAVEDFTGPTHADGVATHQAGNSRGIKIVEEQLHVFFQLVVVTKIGSEPCDRQVGDGVEIVENDAEMFL